MADCLAGVKIVSLAVAAAVAYGIIHDQITARVCVEYFTVGHPPVFGTRSPTLLALGWGIIATWWAGLLLGTPAAILARWGNSPKISAADLIRPIGFLLIAMAVGAAVGAATMYILAITGAIHLPVGLVEKIPENAHPRFLADLGAHNASYAIGFLGGMIVWYHVWRRRNSAVKEAA